MPPIEVDRFRMKSRISSVSRDRVPRPIRGGHFLKGPIPLVWLEKAACLPGRSLHVGIALWFLAGVHKSRVVPLSNHACRRLGLDRNSKYRGLAWLEDAGLVSVKRKMGRAPLVKLQEPEGEP
jgi:DNA-binding transcriptional ArsR family regulator